jgi:hypothetical protein
LDDPGGSDEVRARAPSALVEACGQSPSRLAWRSAGGGTSCSQGCTDGSPT